MGQIFYFVLWSVLAQVFVYLSHNNCVDVLLTTTTFDYVLLFKTSYLHRFLLLETRRLLFLPFCLLKVLVMVEQRELLGLDGLLEGFLIYFSVVMKTLAVLEVEEVLIVPLLPLQKDLVGLVPSLCLLKLVPAELDIIIHLINDRAGRLSPLDDFSEPLVLFHHHIDVDVVDELNQFSCHCSEGARVEEEVEEL
jgi:hypothetical protein